ncbi:MAG: thiolase family protein [Alphaproteobacteria bacterium]|nr:thiolase family protein [Alphaproteobacteria bacterium]
MTDIYITGASRTPMGGFQGDLAGHSAPELGGAAIRGALANAVLDASQVDELMMGCVLPAGLGQAPARQAGFHGGLNKETPATTINKVCGSGMKTIMLSHDAMKAGGPQLMVAGGMESMTNAPYLSRATRGGGRLGHQQLDDHMFFDGLEDAYDKGTLMGSFAEDCAEHYQFSREEQDGYALASLERALKAQQSAAFDGEITPVTLTTRQGDVTISADEQPGKARPEKIPQLKPAFRKNGTVTPANSSSISDGAAALVLASEEAAKAHNLTPRAIIRGHAGHAQEPGWFTTAPVPAARKLMDRLGWSVDDVDLWEVNEAFAVVPMAFMRELGVDHSRLNINGGACALGHPIGASGSRIVVTLLNALEKHNLKKGIAAICLGGGEGITIALERP